MNLQPEYDLIITGGGLVGASLAAVLKGNDLRIAVIEAVPARSNHQPSYDDRGLALSMASIRILQGMGLWPKLVDQACAIRNIHVSDQHHFGKVRFSADILNLPALGYVVIARQIGQALLEVMHTSASIDFFCPATPDQLEIRTDRVDVTVKMDQTKKTISGKLLIAADGTASGVRQFLGISTDEKDYAQTAIVVNVTPEQHHQFTAYERFTQSGPLALLPLADNRCVVVFTVATEDADHYLKIDNKIFLDALEDRFGKRLGRFIEIGQRKSYPIKQVLATQQVTDRAVILGNAAHTIHPNSAQGFNLGLRDVVGLADILIYASQMGEDIGSQQVLHRYLATRQQDQARVTHFSDLLATLFYSEAWHKILVRNFGMQCIDKFPILKKAFLRSATGLSGRQPSLVRL